MEALTLSRKDYTEALDGINNSLTGESYLTQFVITFPGGVNTADVMEICRAIQAPTMDNKIQLMKICIAGRNVSVKCPNGDTETFCMSSEDTDINAVPLFAKEPLALLAIADSIYGYILKKYVRLSKPKAAAAQ